MSHQIKMINLRPGVYLMLLVKEKKYYFTIQINFNIYLRSS